MFRVFVVALALSAVGVPLNGQQGASPAANGAKAVSEFPDRPELLRRIGLYEKAVRQAEAAQSKDPKLVDAYLQLGGMYEEVAMYLKAEDALNRAVALLRDGPPVKLAAAIDHLSCLHGAMGELRKSESEEREALRLREGAGDREGIALSMGSLARLSLRQQLYPEAVSYAQAAMNTIGNDPNVDVAERIAARQLLADALCRTHACDKAIPLLTEEVDLAKSGFGADSLPTAVARYHLGFGYWQTGDFTAAEVWMERGTAGMRPQFGWGHPIYIEAMRQYARLLRQRGELEAASTAERELRRAQSIVDARTFTARGQ